MGQRTERCYLAAVGPTQEALGDTWVWKGGWFRMSPATAPSPRGYPGMVFDEAAGNIVLFSGASSLNDTWTWDGTDWTQQFPPVSPPARNQMG